MKKALSLLLILVMLLGMMPMTAFATEEAEKNPWEGRSAVFVGDSITAGSGTTKLYYRFLEESLGFGSVTGMGIGGSCISSGSDYGNNNTPLINRYKNIPSADLIQIFMGTNDYGHATPIGSPEDTQAGTFYGALNTIIPYLLETHKESKIVFVTPLHRNAKSTGTTSTSEYDPNASGHTLHDYVEAIKQVCATHGVSVIDLYTESEMDPRLDPKNTAYFPDGLHPNAAGHELIAGIMASHIREYEPAESEPIVQTELIQGNKFSTSNDQPCRASSRVNYYLKAGTVITLKTPDVMQWACAKTNGEISSTNLGYFPDSQWTDKETAVVAEDGWVGFVFKYRDETQVFDLSKPLSEYITVEEPHTHSYKSTVTAPIGTEQGYTTYTCECGDSYRTTWLDKTAYEGKTIACVGDSITAGVGVTKDQNDYVKLLADQLGMAYIRLGVSGTTLCTDGSRNCNITRLTEGNLKGADVVTIAMGINDFCAAAEGYYELGDIDSTDSSTIYGAVRMWCERIEELRKTDSLCNTQFYFVTPVIASWNNSVTSARDWDQSKTNIHGYTLRDLCNAIIEVAELYHVAVIDLNLLSGMYYVDAEENNTAVFGGDGVHPGVTGHSMMAKAMANVLLQNNLLSDHTHTFGSWITTTWPSCLPGEQQRVCTTCSATESRVTEVNSEHTYENGICTGCGVKEWDTDGDDVLEILAIGNSFSVDALEYAYQIAQNLGIEEIAIGNLYIGGCTLATHAANAAGDLGKYTYYYNDNGAWTSTGSYKISTALESRSWDYVSMQQGSPVSGVESSYNEDLTNLIAYVKERSDAKLVWHMTWAYQQNSTHSAFPTHGKDQMTMYNAIVSAVQSKIVTNGNFDLIVPNGTAVQNSRTSLLGDTTTRDGYHMSYDYGRYLTGLLFVKTLTGLDISNVTYAPSGVDAEEKAIAIESVNNAAAKPFEVTQSAYVKEEPVLPDEGYILLQPELHKGAYWYPIDAKNYNTPVADATNSKYYFATIRFTRETLPVGSIIVLESGWQYRPDGWITDAVQNSRADTTTESYVVVTEEWWGDYTIRGFNISKIGTPSIMNLSAEDIHKVFRIYVPEEKHSHTYENGVCTLCGATQPGPVITQQPESVQQEVGKKFAITVKAEGDGLTYQWYVKEAGSKAFKVSVNKTSSYAYTMQTYMHNRQVYCVITDANGNSVQTETATITRPPQVLKILEQPKDAQQEIGQKFSISPKVEGEDLTYQWYYKESYMKDFKPSSNKTSAYAYSMQSYMNNRSVYCVITDKYGNSVTTDVATISLPPVELKILEQPTDVFNAKGEKFSIKPTVQGDSLTYQWYYKESYMKDFKPSSNKTSAYAYSMQSYMNNRSVYCVITDKYGNQVQTEIVTIHLEK